MINGSGYKDILLGLIVIITFIILLINELLWRRQKVHHEFSRKFVHIIVGSFIAFWPFIITYNQIRFLSITFIAVIIISKKFNIFRAIHSVERSTQGEFYFALAVGLMTYIAPNHWIYTISLLFMSLADGLAAVIGVRYGRTNQYLIFGQVKSVAGTLTFLIVSLLVLVMYHFNMGVNVFKPLYFAIICLATAIENVGLYGTDNLLVPLSTGLLLRFFT